MKDRLPELQRNISVRHRSRAEEIIIEDDGNDELTEILKEVDKIRGWIHEIAEKTQEMKTIYGYTTFSTTPKLQEQMQSSIAISTALGAKTCGALREFEQKWKNMADENGAISRIMELQYTTMKELCSDTLKNHENFLTKYKASRMELLKEQMKLTNSIMTDEECHRLLESNNTALFVNNHCNDTREAQLMLQNAEIRNQELLKIESALRDIRDMFQQMAVLVYQQEEKVNTVEYFAMQATSHVDEGAKEIQKGKDYLNKAKKKKMFIIICLLIGIIIILGILLL